MNQYQYISAVMSNVHESIESWTRDLLRHAGIETIEVVGTVNKGENRSVAIKCMENF